MKSGEAPKIVQIETRYVQTDAMNFRDVVQSLTGKNASTDWIGRKFSSGSEIKGGGIAVVTANTKPEEGGTSNGAKQSVLPSMLINNVSFKDFDTLLLELPPIDMPWL